MVFEYRAYFTAVYNGHQRQHKDDGLIEDICDGHLYKTHPLFSNDPNTLQ